MILIYIIDIKSINSNVSIVSISNISTKKKKKNIDKKKSKWKIETRLINVIALIIRTSPISSDIFISIPCITWLGTAISWIQPGEISIPRLYEIFWRNWNRILSLRFLVYVTRGSNWVIHVELMHSRHDRFNVVIAILFRVQRRIATVIRVLDCTRN